MVARECAGFPIPSFPNYMLCNRSELSVATEVINQPVYVSKDKERLTMKTAAMGENFSSFSLTSGPALGHCVFFSPCHLKA